MYVLVAYISHLDIRGGPQLAVFSIFCVCESKTVITTDLKKYYTEYWPPYTILHSSIHGYMYIIMQFGSTHKFQDYMIIITFVWLLPEIREGGASQVAKRGARQVGS